MKIKSLAFLVFLIALTLGLSSCGDDKIENLDDQAFSPKNLWVPTYILYPEKPGSLSNTSKAEIYLDKFADINAEKKISISIACESYKLKNTSTSFRASYNCKNSELDLDINFNQKLKGPLSEDNIRENIDYIRFSVAFPKLANDWWRFSGKPGYNDKKTEVSVIADNILQVKLSGKLLGISGTLVDPRCVQDEKFGIPKECSVFKHMDLPYEINAKFVFDSYSDLGIRPERE